MPVFGDRRHRQVKRGVNCLFHAFAAARLEAVADRYLFATEQQDELYTLARSAAYKRDESTCHGVRPSFGRVELTCVYAIRCVFFLVLFRLFSYFIISLKYIVDCELFGRHRSRVFLLSDQQSGIHCRMICVIQLLTLNSKLHLTTSELWFGQEQEGILP